MTSRTLGVLSSLTAAMGLMLVIVRFGAAEGAEAVAQTNSPSIKIGAPVAVTDDASLPSLVESWLTVDPAQGNHLIATALFDDGAHSLVAYSLDAGRTWARGAHETGVIFPDIDPIATFTTSGRALFATLDRGFHVWTSSDSGANWADTTIVSGGSYDREWIVEDQTAGPRRGWLYAAGKIGVHVFGSRAQDIAAISRSRDGGRTFESPRLLLPDPSRESLHTVSDALVDGHGSLILAMPVFSWTGTDAAGLLDGRYLVVQSADGARSFGEPSEATRFRVYGHANERSSIKALGGGRLALDRTIGPYQGRLYLAYLDTRAGYSQIVVARSPDGGTTWLPSVRVNDLGFDVNQSNPAIAVNRDGVVAVTWNDRRHDPTDRCFEPFVAVSTDGGQSFRSNTAVADVRSCPADGRWLNGGDTQGLVSLPDGRFVSAWIGGVPKTRLWVSMLDVLR